ncbi:zinc finger protein 521 [Halyomorpha halys]|uniref:zinc finger protein 521 n=1 Tax=Halyomorpha halys TaxID=286706 RepID=UPI0006D50938|nr:zinc finger protein 521 [Halyomorpha halys]
MASALLHMSCPSLKNDIIGMESHSFSETLQGLEGAKRDHDLEDLDRSQVKKRRKQSKPNRITSTELFSEVDIKSSVWVTVQQNQPLIPAKESGKIRNCDISFCNVAKENKAEQKHDSEAEESSEDNCSGMYNSNKKKDFSFPLNLSHKTPSPQDSVDSFSSTIDERGWYKNSDSTPLIYNLHNPDQMNLKNQTFQNNLFQQSQPCNLILPGFKKIVVGNNDNQISSPHRIFNPEAFCDLCNKEFCNKYFLKTHKANKHGIYMENIGPNPIENLTSLPLMNYFSSSIANLSLSNTQINKKLSTNFNNNSNKSNSSMRAFCNICQREFCNKYFVRRHKAKIHGIIENNGDVDFKQQIITDKIDISDSNLPGPSTIKFPKEFQSSKEVTEHVIEEEKPTVKKEENESEDTNSPHDALSLLVSTWQSEDSKDCSKSPDRNKKLQTSNNSAFCDICCKEYCNKYFLRVHKQKCHGIPFPEKDDKLKEINNVPSKSSQSMPLNLILRENNKNHPENDCNYTCSICNINFADNYSIKIHNEQVHKNDKPLNNANKSFQVTDQNAPIKTNFDIPNPRLNDTSSQNVHTHEKTNSCPKKNSNIDIQKMNGMLLKLNQHIPFENHMCDVCNQDFGSISTLENHIIRDHASLIEEISNSFYEENQTFPINQYNKLECIKCQKNFQSMSHLEQHFAEKHSICEPKSSLKISNENQDINSQLSATTDRQVMHTPTSSFCEICKKELCNKYFMKTHMQRMHGISIENGAHIGGVVCDICNKELCSKYFLRVHKQNSHGIVEEAFLPQIGSEIKVPMANSDIALRPNENELNHRYFSHFTEVCTICNRRFRSAKWLRAHLLNDHGEEGKDKWKEVQLQNGNKPIDRPLCDSAKKTDPYYSQSYKNFIPDIPLSDSGPSTSDQNCEMLPSFLNRNTSKQYQCSYCPFSTAVLALLLVHERTHLPIITDMQDMRCPICAVCFDNSESLDKHLTLKHSLPMFPFKKNPEETGNFNENSHVFQCEEMENKAGLNKDDNNYEEITDSKFDPSPQADACLKCNRCSYMTHHIELYSEHIKNEHKLDEPQMDYLQIIRDALLQIANNSHIPASFAVPNNLGNFMMQPFVLEDKAFGANSPSTFLSSLVFLPVKERLDKPITASFKLTPT